MSDVVIKVEDISKQYRLGKIGTGSLRHDLNRWWHLMRGKEDPYLKIGEVNDRTKKGESEYVWALKDINFEVKRGEVLGIIGRNGAGKSTLLKILSRTTLPTTGQIKTRGRIASLLEVGTGFHPELTGRENIFLNGAILGMRKAEIQRRLDEIINFSGVERYIDTPVKRYSSGMYVRLAFAVAAHLESEILIVDEVLAVGDAQFQKKCLGKMGEVSKGEGRTVLFVSHNISAVRSLCKNGLILNGGLAKEKGAIDIVSKDYLNEFSLNQTSRIFKEGHFIKNVRLCAANIFANSDLIKLGDDLILEVDLLGLNHLPSVHIGFFIKDIFNVRVATFSTVMVQESFALMPRFQKERFRFFIKNLPLVEGRYYVDFVLAQKIGGRLEYIEDCLTFEIGSSNDLFKNFKIDSYFGYSFLNVKIDVKSLD